MNKMKINFSEELQNDLLNGATIVYTMHGEYNLSILIRFPKNQWVEFDNNYYEYIEYQDAVDDFTNTGMFRAIYRNGHIRTVKRNCYDDYYETRHLIKKAIQNKNLRN